MRRTPAERNRCLSDFKQILSLVPNFSETLDAIDNVAALLNLVNEVRDRSTILHLSPH
jgi:hypothetical protein